MFFWFASFQEGVSSPYLSSNSERKLSAKMPASGTALDKNIKQEVEAFKMKQKDAKVPWIIFEIKQNEANVEVVTIAKKGDATDNLATLHEELKRRHAAYFILDYDPPEELRAKKGIAKNQNFPMTCFWCGDCAKISEKMKYSSTVATLKSATSSLKVYFEAHDFDDISDESLIEKVKKI